MFDVGFSEMLVIAVVALIVIGPEKLPKVARTIGLLVGRMQRYVGNVKSDIEREMQFEDLQKLQQEIKQGLVQTQAEVSNAASSAKKEVAALEREIESSLVTDHSVTGNIQTTGQQPVVTEQSPATPTPASKQQSLALDIEPQPQQSSLSKQTVVEETQPSESGKSALKSITPPAKASE